MEYYGEEAFKDNFVVVGGVGSQNSAEARKRRAVEDFENIFTRQKRQTPEERFAAVLARGSDPTVADTDGDLIPDGVETKSGMDRRKKDDIDDDRDNDNLNTLQEVIQHTDPK